ncbi:SMC-Scp complex subunit ScpB [Nanoarchaeota archaeon]
MADAKKEVEAILFSAGRVVEVKEFQKILNLRKPGLITEAIKDIKEEYSARESPIMIVDEGEGWKLAVREMYLPMVQRINPHTELSKSILETLAVITWKQPIIQSDVIKIRTNKAYDHIAELQRLGFITKVRHGRSYALKVTQKFLDYFDLPDMSSIKEVFKDFKDVETAVQKKAEEKMDKKEEAKPEEQVAEPAEPGSQETKEEGTELEPYIDVLPEVEHPKPENKLEVYEGPSAEEEDTAHKEEGESEETGEQAEADAEADAEEEEGEESEADKTRRIAKELLEEEKREEPEEIEAAERELHPELEQFIEKSIDEIKPKGTEDHREETEEPEEGEEHEGAEEHEPAEEPEAHEEAESGDKNKQMPAEEYPGQFAKDAAAEQEGEEHEEEPSEEGKKE